MRWMVSTSIFKEKLVVISFWSLYNLYAFAHANYIGEKLDMCGGGGGGRKLIVGPCVFKKAYQSWMCT